MMGDFGLSVHINLFGCNHEKICDIEYIKAWMIDLCNFIEMKRHGDMIRTLWQNLFQVILYATD